MKSMTKKNGGFTLVELVVAVAILGIITAIALPTIGNLKNKNEKKKYVSYENSITSSAKLYIDQYEEDVFNKKDYNQQCKSITYGDLKNHNLLKDYKLDNVTCSGIGEEANPDDKIVAYVVKDSSGNYKYYPKVTCQKDGKTVFTSGGTLPLSCEKTKVPTAQITTSDTCFYQSNNKKQVNIDVSIKQIDKEYDLFYALIDYKSANNPDAIKKLTYKNIGRYNKEQDNITIDISDYISKEPDYKEYNLVLKYTFGSNEETEYEVVDKTIRIDYTEPIMQITAKKLDKNKSDYKSGTWTNQDVTLSATAKNNCGKTINMKESSTNKETITVEQEGKHEVVFTTPYGNGWTATKSINVNIDKTAPTVEIAYGNTTKTYTGDNKENVFDISNVASITDKSAKAEIDKIKWYKNDINYSVKITDKYTIGSTNLIKNVIHKSPTDSEKAKNEQQSKAIKNSVNKEINVLEERTVSLEDTGYRQGWYTVEDMAGNKTSVRLTAALDQEKPTSPTSTITTTKINQTKQTSYNGTWTNQTTNWKEFNSSDQSYGSGVSGIYYREDGQNDWKIVDNSYTFKNIDKKFYLKSVDKAGNESTASGPYIFKVDQIAPTCETTYSGGYNGEWTSKDVILVGVCQDNASGCTSETQNVSKKLTKSESSTASPGVVKDVAGNKTTCPNKAYKIDKTTPRCSIAASGVQGDSNWYKSKVDLKLSAKTDGPSKIKYTLTNARTSQPSYDNSTAKQQAAETNGTNWYGYVENEAGTKNSCDIFIKVDTIAPTCQVNIGSGTPGKNGWYTSNVALNLNRIEDNGSPIKGYGLSQGTTKNKYNSTTTGTQSNSTASGTTWYGYVKDEAGNEGSCKTATAIKVDTTTPTCSIAARGTEGNNGWYRSDVSLTLDAQAKGASGISYDLTKSTTPTYKGNKTLTQSTETTNTIIYGYVENEAGTATNCQKNIKIDKTPPKVVLEAANMNTPTTIYGNQTFSGTVNTNNGFHIFDISNVANISSSSNSTAINSIKWYGKDGVNYTPTITDSNGIDQTYWKWNNSNVSPTASAASKNASATNSNRTRNKNGNTNVSDPFSLGGNGYRQGWYTVTDVAGNQTKVQVIVANDNKAPSAPTATVKVGGTTKNGQKSYNSGWTKNKIVWSNFQSTETNAMSPVTYYYKNASNNTWKKFGSTSYTYPQNSDKEMNRTYYIKAIDAAGNESKESGPFIFKIDQIPPTCETTYTGGYNGGWTASSVTLKGTCSDTGGSGCTSATSTVTNKISAAGSENYSPGTVKDNAGNSTKCSSKSVKIDGDYPKITVTAYKKKTESCTGMLWWKECTDILSDSVLNGTYTNKDLVSKIIEVRGQSVNSSYENTVNGWLNNANYPHGVYYKIHATDSSKITLKWQYNAAGKTYPEALADNSRTTKTIGSNSNDITVSAASNEDLHIGDKDDDDDDGYRIMRVTATDEANHKTSVDIVAPLDRKAPTANDFRLKKASSGKFCLTVVNKDISMQETPIEQMAEGQYSHICSGWNTYWGYHSTVKYRPSGQSYYDYSDTNKHPDTDVGLDKTWLRNNIYIAASPKDACLKIRLIDWAGNKSPEKTFKISNYNLVSNTSGC